jgi:signal transduction histidine kinase
LSFVTFTKVILYGSATKIYHISSDIRERGFIEMLLMEERVLLEIHDNGKGFAMEKMSVSIGHELANVQTRARSVGGDVDISSVFGEGTTVFAWVPRHARQ